MLPDELRQKALLNPQGLRSFERVAHAPRCLAKRPVLEGMPSQREPGSLVCWWECDSCGGVSGRFILAP